ncbi:apolipoprotein N-acyltransferase [Polymorphobacter multimanifer]|uniref:apolipoprotein N-acyltransferase n=1 Tax=Polymorphobacter multimanifer TaxID=1070431 RepID=UPI001669F6D4|nr:apolipoprotein N-acyltransferase [Polymorphobacter multimanifer]GGI71556.1 apolipoprotein N-acyltransferase [Polymorphobacter multimanifer]
MFLDPRLRLPLAFAAGVATALGFAPTDFWILAILGTAMLVGLVDTAPSRRNAAATGWVWGFAMFATSLTWIATAFTFQSAMPAAMGWVAVLGLSAFLALYPMIASVAARALPQPGLARLLVLAGAFMITEWLRGVLFSGFSWNPLGVAWLASPGIAQLARDIGAQGLSGLMVIAGGGLWLLLGPQRTLTQRGVGVAIAAFMLLSGLIGRTYIQNVYFPDNPTLVIVQPNIGQDEKYDEGANARHLERYLAITREAVADSTMGGAVEEERSDQQAAAPFAGVDENAERSGGDQNPPEQEVGSTISETLAGADLAERPNLVIWSESAVFGLPEEDPALRRKLATVLRPRDLLLFGGVAAERDAAGNIDKLRNSLFVLDASARILARYDKAHLTPLGEYVPARGIMETIGLARLAPGGIDFAPGPGPKTFSLPGIPPFSAMICYEIIFGGRVTEYGQRPAWIVNISNDAWFGPTGPPQHLAQARLRSIEEGLPLARATPTGISAVIGPSGGIFAQQDAGISGFIRTTLPPPLPATPSAIYGDQIPLGLSGLLLISGVVLWRRRTVL